MNYKSLILGLVLLLPSATFAEEKADTAFSNLYRRYFQLYSDSDDTAFYQASEQLKNYYLQHDNKDSYYKVYLNEILYDTEHGKTYRAIKKANVMLQDMEQGKEKRYDIVYSALGNIYDLRGNYRLAKKYYNDALKACAPTDTVALVGIYARIAALLAHREPQKAMEVNDYFGAMTANTPQYHKVYVVQKGEISLYLKDKHIFEEAYQEYLKICKERPLLDIYGADMMNMLKAAFSGDYDTALEILSHNSTDFDALDRCDMRIVIYEMMGNRQLALNEVAYRRDLRDSLNSDMLFESINEINSEMGMKRVEEQARKDRERAMHRQQMLMVAIIILLLVALGLIASRYLMRRRMQKKLLKKNRELEIALSRAEESDRMKTSFIEHVSHEIRTPLNIITGYAQIVTNNDYELDEKDRNRMLNDIKHNTMEITEIVNELLEVAQDESKEYYPKDDVVAINDFCREMIGKAAHINDHQLRLDFITECDDAESIHTNRGALEKIISQLYSNAIKFTKEGSIELHVYKSPDRGIVRFIITDTGIGIPEEHQERVFERFYKVDSFKQGFGLGLTMSRKIAILLSGSLYIDSDYKTGARFILSLPTS